MGNPIEWLEESIKARQKMIASTKAIMGKGNNDKLLAQHMLKFQSEIEERQAEIDRRRNVQG